MEAVFDVLVVEDDPTLRQQTAQLIALWGYRVRVADDMATALAELDRAPAHEEAHDQDDQRDDQQQPEQVGEKRSASDREHDEEDDEHEQQGRQRRLLRRVTGRGLAAGEERLEAPEQALGLALYLVALALGAQPRVAGGPAGHFLGLPLELLAFAASAVFES